MGAISRSEDGGPSRTGTADILSAPGTTDISLALPAIGEDLNAEHVGRVSGPSRGCGRPGVSGLRNPPVVRGQLSVISYQLSVISYQLSVISYQLSVISYQLSVIRAPLRAP